MNRYLIYVRVSKQVQDVRTQQDQALEWIRYEERGQPFEHEFYVDYDVSSQLPMHKRPALMQMLGDLKKGVRVWVYHSDRLARKALETHTIYNKIIQAGATLISATEPALSDPIYLGVAAGYAQKVHDQLRLRVKHTLQSKKKRGERYSRWLPYGYDMDMSVKIVSRDRQTGEEVLKYGKLIPNEKERKILQKIVEMSNNDVSLGGIVRALTDQRLHNREGKPFNKTSIARIIKRHQTQNQLELAGK